MQILFIGDIFGSAGRKIVHDHLPHLVTTHKVDLVIANAENAAGGFGLTGAIAEEFLDLGCDVLTTGNHIWDKREIMDYFNSANGNANSRARRVLRPANFAQGVPGTGLFEGVTKFGQNYAVINLQGRVFMQTHDDPFRKADELLRQITSKVIIVDMHAEATSEKIALGWYLDGRVTGVIGVQKEQILQRFLTGLPGRFEAAKGDPRFCAVLIECDAATGRANSIQRLMLG